MDINTKLGFYVFADGITEGDNLSTSGSTTIHKHQCLLIVDTSTAQALSLPATLLYHPAGRNFLMATVYLIMRHRRILGCERLIFVFWDDGIHKETAGITHHLWIGQFGIPDIYDDIAHLLGGRLCDALLL